MKTDFDFSGLATTRLLLQGKEQIVAIDREDCTASLTLKGGQVLTFTPHGQHPVLWHNNRLDFNSKEPLRQGIPICWPWFGDLSRNPDPVRDQYLALTQDPKTLPNHGLVRNKQWELLDIQEAQDATRVLLMAWLEQPKLRLLANYSFGSDLSIQLNTENRSNTTVHFSCALHSYFAVSDIGNIHIPDLDGIPYFDTLKRWEKHVHSGDLNFHSEVDRAFVDTPGILRIKDQGWRRVITIESAESHSAVVWNPWEEKSRHLSQFSPNAYKTMVCLESAKILRDSVKLDSGASTSLTVKINSQNI
jgi:glucose-6-phosphate 1-epimerase